MLTLQEENLLLFTQIADGSFITIDVEANITKYTQRKGQLERSGELFVHAADAEFIKTFSDYESFIMNEEVLIARSKLIYLQSKKSSIIKGVLEGEDLSTYIKSDCPYN